MNLLKHLSIGVIAVATGAFGAGCADDSFESDQQAAGGVSEGARLFNQATFGGNGRTCESCHSKATGTRSPAELQQLFQDKPNHPLFQHDGADTIGGSTFNRIQAHATVLIPIDLPSNVSIVGDPGATDVVFPRGIPTTFNTPALDTVLMYDGRAPDLPFQAADAIERHAQAAAFTQNDVEAIADFQKTLFNRQNLSDFVKNGTPLTLPYGTTDAEIRGRRFFIDDSADSPFDVGQGFQPCGWCHSGPFLNEVSFVFANFIEPSVNEGERFTTVLVSELNPLGNPTYDFEFTNPDGSTTVVTSPDLGLALQTGDVNDALFLNGAVLGARFKTPTLWGAADTAPYFHDNSANNLEELTDHYQIALDLLSGGFIQLTEQDKADIVAYMKLL